MFILYFRSYKRKWCAGENQKNGIPGLFTTTLLIFNKLGGAPQWTLIITQLHSISLGYVDAPMTDFIRNSANKLLDETTGAEREQLVSQFKSQRTEAVCKR